MESKKTHSFDFENSECENSDHENSESEDSECRKFRGLKIQSTENSE